MKSQEAQDARNNRLGSRTFELMVEMCNALSAYAYAIDTLLGSARAGTQEPLTSADIYAFAKAHREMLANDPPHDRALRARIETLLNGGEKVAPR